MKILIYIYHVQIFYKEFFWLTQFSYIFVKLYIKNCPWMKIYEVILIFCGYAMTYIAF